jgi:lipopolysaccharide export system protein LptC
MNNHWKMISNVILLMILVISGWLYYATDKQSEALNESDLGAKYGCSYLTHPFPISIKGVDVTTPQ